MLTPIPQDTFKAVSEEATRIAHEFHDPLEMFLRTTELPEACRACPKLLN